MASIGCALLFLPTYSTQQELFGATLLYVSDDINDAPSGPQSLHPNLARLAVRYDEIYTRYRAGQLSAEKARALMESLVERDDEGVKWGVDPDTGRFVRRTAFGALEFDTPPTSGVSTPDAFTYSQGRSDDPALRLHVFSDESMQRPPAPRITGKGEASQVVLFRPVFWLAVLLLAVVLVVGLIR